LSEGALHVSDVERTFALRDSTVQALDRVSLSAPVGSFVAREKKSEEKKRKKKK